MLEWALDAYKMVEGDDGPESSHHWSAGDLNRRRGVRKPAGRGFCEYGLAFRKMTKASVMPVGYQTATSAISPLPRLPEGGYEVDDAIKYYGVKMIGPQCEAIIMNAMKEYWRRSSSLRQAHRDLTPLSEGIHFVTVRGYISEVRITWSESSGKPLSKARRRS